ncbi:FUT1_2 [Mytilus edulis]|uniref:L-Fucosyltransferase n=1 Tax=Mytilus edulis TaxID=6550 RepID=A0A8S3QUA1_MYTED|nr:FUT1_2 [Mytilus edulis]
MKLTIPLAVKFGKWLQNDKIENGNKFTSSCSSRLETCCKRPAVRDMYIWASWSKYILILILTLGLCQFILKNYNEESVIYCESTNSTVNVNSDEPKKKSTIPRTYKQYVKVEFIGRLGNLLFQYASLYGIAKHHNMIPVVDEGCHLKKHFKISAISVNPLVNLKRYVRIKVTCLGKNAFKLDTKYNWTIKGYFQSWKYFVENRIEIRKEFQFKENVQIEPINNFKKL